MRDGSRFVILCVCTGNICRSPAAERILAARLGPSVEVSSAGTCGLVGWPIAEPMARRLRSAGLSADRFAGRCLLAWMASSADLVLGMTKGHRADVVELVPTVLRRSFTLLEFARLLSELRRGELPDGTPGARLGTAVAALASRRRPSPGSDDIGDPFGRSDEEYERAFGEIDEAVSRIAEVIAAPR